MNKIIEELSNENAKLQAKDLENKKKIEVEKFKGELGNAINEVKNNKKEE